MSFNILTKKSSKLFKANIYLTLMFDYNDNSDILAAITHEEVLLWKLTSKELIKQTPFSIINFLESITLI